MEGILVEEGTELRARVAVDLSCCPLTAISRRYPELEFSIVEKQDLERAVLASILVDRTDVGGDFLTELSEAEEVKALRRIGGSAEGWKVRLRLTCSSCFVRELAEESGFVPDEIAFAEGSMVLTFALEDHGELRDLLDEAESGDVGPTRVLELYRGEEGDLYADDPVARSDITDRQMEILSFAYERGYFDRSREINIGEIADEFGLHPSTVSSHLRVGVRKVLEQVL